MPYPVLPPSPPPIVDVLTTGEVHSANPLHVNASAASSTSGEEDLLSPGGSLPSDQTDITDQSECIANCDAAENSIPSSEEAATLEGTSSAVLLGSPVAIDRTSATRPSQPSALDLQASPELPTVLPRTAISPISTIFLPSPELDTLVRIRRSLRPVETETARTTGSSVEISQNSGSSPEAVPASGYNGDSIRLDLPFPDSTPPDSEIPDSQQPSNSTPTESTTESDPSPNAIEQPPTDQLPQPVPQPTGGEVLTIPSPPPREQDSPGQAAPTAPGTASPPIDLQQQGEVVEITADQQQVDERRQVFQADGNVVVRFRQAVLSANRVRLNGPNRVAVAEGNALLTRGDQVLGGDRFEFNFALNQGEIQGARGQLLIPATEQDFNTDPLADLGEVTPRQPATTRVSLAQPVQVISGTPGIAFGVGDLRSSSSNQSINRLRFEADQAEFEGGNLVARNVRITNDPFSPPELELRSSEVTYTRLSPTLAEIRAKNPRLVFDQGFTLPLLVNRLVLDQRRRNGGLLNFGFDERDRDGFFIERTFDLYSSPQVYFSVTPQILIQRAINQGEFPQADQFGLVANAEFTVSPTTNARAVASFSSLDFEEIEDNLRASFRAQHRVFNHTVAAEYSYRDRLFNGSLGFQTVQSSLGLVVSSPLYVLGNSLINLRYQGSVQYINAQTDQRDLLPLDRTNQPPGTPDSLLPLDPDRDLNCIDPDERDTTGNGCVSLTRYQAAVNLNRLFYLWTGTALPPTPTEGLRYSPYSLTPYVGIFLNAQGVLSGYSSGDSQSSLQGGITLLGQFGHFSRPFLDYTSFNIGYSRTLQDGESPFLFDRVADQQVLSAGLTQQIYGPLRAGVQLSYNLETSDDIDTVYTLEYSRRTYSIIASYSTGRQTGYLTFRLNDFNWTGDPGPFSGLGSNPVESGLIRGIN